MDPGVRSLPTLYRWIGLGVVVAGLAWFLAVSGVDLRVLSGWLVFACGFLIFGEVAGWCSARIWAEDVREHSDIEDKIKELPGDEDDKDTERRSDRELAYRIVKEEAAQHRRDTMRGLVEIAFLVITVFGVLLVSPGKTGGLGNGLMVRFAEPVEGGLSRLGGAPQGPGGSGSLFVQLSPELERAMLSYFNGGVEQRGGSSFVGAVPWLVLLAVAIAAIVFALTAKEHPATAPVLGVVPLAIAAIEHAENLSRFHGWSFWIVFVVFLALALWLMFFGKDSELADVSSSGETKKVDSRRVMGFSVLVLLWVLVVITYRTPEAKEAGGGDTAGGSHAGSEPPAPGAGGERPVAAGAFQVLPLKTTPLFHPGQSDTYFFGEAGKGRVDRAAALAEVEKVLAETQAGDTLLLLGSADCTSYRAGNAVLAENRAETVRHDLLTEAQRRGVNVNADALPQHNACKDTGALRAVFPFRIRAESSR